MEIYGKLMIMLLAFMLDGAHASTRTDRCYNDNQRTLKCFISSSHGCHAVSMQELCGSRVDKKDAWRLRSHDGLDAATTGDRLQPECTFVLQALRTSQAFLVSFGEYFILQDEASEIPTVPPANGTNSTQSDFTPMGTGCNSSYLQIWDGDVINDVNLLLTVCGTGDSVLGLPSDVVESQTQFLTVRLTVHPTATVNVTIVTTSFDSGPCTDEVTELKCRNGLCVPRTVRCDNVNNCGDNTDQLVSSPANCTLATFDEPIDFPWEILLAVLGAILTAFLLYWLFWRPGYIPWRVACCRNLLRGCCQGCCKGCCEKCACRPYGKPAPCESCCCCHRICVPRGFGGCCHGDGTRNVTSGDAGGRTKSAGLLAHAHSDSYGGKQRNGKPGGRAGTSYLCCPCGGNGNQGGREGLDGEHEDRNMWKDGNTAYWGNGGDGGHVRESR
ncbi:uncharacterized protein LOC119736537 [Patiria miniata]|uniref:CUB domain-containing protein n=1 Tax=Patiria miniata TaxID=46514 RepID=A0A914AS48_PATMI|nr:uncharacterized protein LOC119736537 [Patiria miniata]